MPHLQERIRRILGVQISWLTFFSKYGASTSSLHRLSMLWIAPSSLLYSDRMSLPRNTGIILHVGKRFSYAFEENDDKVDKYTHKTTAKGVISSYN